MDKDPRSELKRMHQQKIMEIQQKYQEDMEDIGMSHAAAYAQSQLEKRQTGLCEEQREIDRLNVLRRGEEAKKIIQQSSKVKCLIKYIILACIIFFRNIIFCY